MARCRNDEAVRRATGLRRLPDQEAIAERQGALGERLAVVLSGRCNLSQISAEGLFLPRISGEALVLRPGSIFFREQERDVPVSQICVYAMVAAAMQRAREADFGDGGVDWSGFDENPFVRSVLDLACLCASTTVFSKHPCCERLDHVSWTTLRATILVVSSRQLALRSSGVAITMSAMRLSSSSTLWSQGRSHYGSRIASSYSRRSGATLPCRVCRNSCREGMRSRSISTWMRFNGGYRAMAVTGDDTGHQNTPVSQSRAPQLRPPRCPAPRLPLRARSRRPILDAARAFVRLHLRPRRTSSPSSKAAPMRHPSFPLRGG